MLIFNRTDEFKDWLKRLGKPEQLDINEYIDHITFAGQLPKKSCTLLKGTGGIWEIKFDFGPGYRVYFCRTGYIIYLLLNGGDKDTQAADITRAQEIKNRATGG
jgi:putative addiction module killer protein